MSIVGQAGNERSQDRPPAEEKKRLGVCIRRTLYGYKALGRVSGIESLPPAQGSSNGAPRPSCSNTSNPMPSASRYVNMLPAQRRSRPDSPTIHNQGSLSTGGLVVQAISPRLSPYCFTGSLSMIPDSRGKNRGKEKKRSPSRPDPQLVQPQATWLRVPLRNAHLVRVLHEPALRLIVQPLLVHHLVLALVLQVPH